MTPPINRAALREALVLLLADDEYGHWRYVVRAVGVSLPSVAGRLTIAERIADALMALIPEAPAPRVTDAMVNAALATMGRIDGVRLMPDGTAHHDGNSIRDAAHAMLRAALEAPSDDR